MTAEQEDREEREDAVFPFPLFSTFSELIKGHMISDAIISLGGLNVIAGELER